MVLLLLSSLGASQELAAQERCGLRITAPSRNSVGTPGGRGIYTTHLGGGTVTLRCGGAVMTGDSAVHFESEERAEMIRQVVYRDTARTLSADRLTYYERSGQVVATGNVVLTRLATGARLEGPAVSFFRAGSPGGRTLATGRPHMTIPARGGGEAIEVDADEAEFIGDSVSIGRGFVEIGRSDFDATADSAVFGAERGRLYGRPIVTSRGMRLEGDSIHARLAPGGLDRLHAFGSARGTGETLDLASDQILVVWGSDDVERVQAFGVGRALAASETFLIAADSIDFALSTGAPDSVTAFRQARTFQLSSPRQGGAVPIEPAADLSDERSWIEGERIRAWFEDPATEGPRARQARVRRLRATGEARSYFSAVRDSAQSDRPSRNYIIGESILLDFSDGEPVTVTADQAIGVFLEPVNGEVPGPASNAGNPEPVDTAEPAADETP